MYNMKPVIKILTGNEMQTILKGLGPLFKEGIQYVSYILL